MVKGISQWFLAVLDEKYCLEQLRGEAGNSLYFVGFVKCEPIDVRFFFFFFFQSNIFSTCLSYSALSDQRVWLH